MSRRLTTQHHEPTSTRRSTTAFRDRIMVFFKSPEFQTILQHSGKSKGFIYVLICDSRLQVPSTDPRSSRTAHGILTGYSKEPAFTMTRVYRDDPTVYYALSCLKPNGRKIKRCMSQWCHTMQRHQSAGVFDATLYCIGEFKQAKSLQ